MKSVLFFLFIINLISCKKNVVEETNVIKGQLLESSSNPIPLTNYTLHFYQKSTSGLLGGQLGLDQDIKTDINGNFNFTYKKTRNFGASSGGVNEENISIYGFEDINQIPTFQPVWLPIKSAIDVNLEKIYRYKKISKLIRKVKFNDNLNVGESIELISTNGSGSDYKTLIGPISSGTVLNVDTITNCRLNFFNLTNSTYSLSLTLYRIGFSKDTNYIVNKIDENIRTIEISYK